MKPILFSTAMVQAILENRKTQTRRVVRPQPIGEFIGRDGNEYAFGYGPEIKSTFKQRYEAGDVLYVREKFRLIDFFYVDDDWNASVQYADMTRGPRLHYLKNGSDERTGWRPSIHMPKEAARIFLQVKGAWIEALNVIADGDVIAEGCITYKAFSELWNSLNAKRGYAWDSNPWVEVVSFERMKDEV